MSDAKSAREIINDPEFKIEHRTLGPRPRPCQRCHEEFVTETWFESTCPECLKDQMREEIERRESSWMSICPKAFLKTYPEKLPCKEQYQAVMDWKYQPRGLLLIGPTGKGKSRCAWATIKAKFIAGRSFKCLNALSGMEYGAKFTESTQAVKVWLDTLCAVDILFMDDIFKAKFTDSFEGAMFGVITVRTENELPIIITANDTGATLAGRMTDDRGEPMVRRMREFCNVISF